MAQFYDISSMITNEVPKLQIREDLIVTINNRKSTILNIRAMAEENERKPVEEQSEELELMDKALNMLIGKKHTKEIQDMDLPINEYRKLYESVMLVAQGQDPNGTP